ncbi:hypothetical protein DMH01_38690 [Amycolatopsis sp. WAC 04182]|nr:hypothetical protein DMH01_38690 [Amycolatopsis sp. WAC 04182]
MAPGFVHSGLGGGACCESHFRNVEGCESGFRNAFFAGGRSVKASLPTLTVGKGPFATFGVAALAPGAPATTAGTAAAREGPLPSAQPRKLDLHTLPST